MKRSQVPAEPLVIFDPTPPSWGERLKPLGLGLLLCLLLGGLVFGFRYFELAEYVDKALLRELIAPFGIWAPGIFILLFIVGTLTFVVPFAVMAGLGGLLFGTAWGSFWTVIGATLGSTVLLFLMRTLGQKWVKTKTTHPRWENLNERLEADGFYYLLLVRSLSILPYNVFNTACAFIRVRYRDFVLSNLVGLIPAAVIYSYGTRLLLDPNTPKSLLVLFVGALATLIIVPLVFRNTRRRRRRQLKQR